MNRLIVFGGAAVALILAAVIGTRLLASPGTGGIGAVPSATPSATSSISPSPSPTAPAGASPTVDLIGDWLDTSRWTTYVSERYKFTIGHPATWTMIESTHCWQGRRDDR